MGLKLRTSYILLVISIVILAIGIILITMRIAKFIAISRTLIDRSRLATLFNYSAFTLIGRIARNFRFNLDNFVIAGFLGLNFVTVYSIAARLIKYFMEFIVSAVGITTPVFSQYEARGDYKSIKEVKKLSYSLDD